MKKVISIILILAIVLLVGVCVAKNKVFNDSEAISKEDTVYYSNPTYGLKFRFPKKYGDIILTGPKKLPNSFVPEADGVKTYANYASVVGLVPEYSNKITFSNLQKPEQYSSTTPVITEIYIIDLSDPSLKNLVSSPINNENITLSEEKKLLESVPDGYLTKSDTAGYYLKKDTTKNGLIVVENDGVGSIGTYFEKMYQIYNKNLVIEISVTYIPFAYTPEASEQKQYTKGKQGNDFWIAHQDYLNKGKTSQKLRDSFAEAERIVNSLTISD